MTALETVFMTGLSTLTAALGGAADQGSQPPTETLTLGDYDGDGRLDVLALGAAGLRLLHNAGGGAFEERTLEAGLDARARPSAAAWGDWDGDGRLDLLLAGATPENRLYLQVDPGTFLDCSDAGAPWSGYRVTGARSVDLDGDALDDLHLSTATGDLLLRSAGNGLFEPVASPVRLPAASAAALSRGPAGAEAASGADPATSFEPGEADLALAAGACVAGVLDQAVGACLPASSVPTLGMLYPMSSELFVDSTNGNVGVGTLAPGARLDVVGSLRASGQLVSSNPTGPPLDVASSTRVDGLNADLLDGQHASAFSQFGAAVDSFEIAAGAVDASALADKAVQQAKIASDAVGTDQIGDRSIQSNDLALNAVTGAELANGAVSAAKILAGAVGNAALADGAVTGPKIATGSVGSSALASGAVTGSTVANGTLTNADLSTEAAISGTKVVPSFGSQNVVTTGYADVGYGSSTVPTYRFSPSEASGLSSPVVETLSLLTSGAERVRVASDGDVGVGTPSPAARLHTVQASAFSPAVYGEHTGTGYGVWAQSNGALEALAVTQDGSGDIITGYAGGSVRFRVRNSGNVQVRTLTITGGSDLVERFPGAAGCEPGVVVTADRSAPGSVSPSSRAYDAAVLGVVSGAGGVQSGVQLSQEGVLEGDVAVALTGRVYARCTAAGGPIQPGDLLTTSDLAGHAMRAADRGRAPGAIVGKALGPLAEGTGLVLVLVNLQ